MNAFGVVGDHPVSLNRLAGNSIVFNRCESPGSNQWMTRTGEQIEDLRSADKSKISALPCLSPESESPISKLSPAGTAELSPGR
jgi:hypothetical protein